MRGLVFVLMILAGLLVFGCVGTPSDGGTTQETGGATTPTTEETTEESTPETTEESTAEEPETTEPSGDGMDLTDLTYLELAALGVPVECDVTVSSQGMVYTAKMYMAGEDKIRYESSYAGQDTVAIMIDDVTYIKLDPPYAGCEWIMSEGNLAEGTETPEAGTSMHTTVPDLEGMASTDYECKPWTYDDSKFTVPVESVCTNEEFAERMLGDMQVPDGYQ